jgi:SrtB family sortase
MILPDLLTKADYEDIADRVKTDSSDDDDGDDPEAPDGEEAPSEEDGKIDFGALSEELPDSVGWVRVDDTSIDYPVVQGEDNEWYLYHDPFGRESYSSVFLDYRVQPDDRAIIIYSHTHAIDAGFHAIAETHEQWRFDEMADVHWITPGAGETVFKPAFALHVLPDFQDIQQFEFESDVLGYENRVRELLDGHKARGEWNTTTLSHFDILGVNCIQVDPAAGGRDGIGYWWRMTDAEEEQAREAGSVSAYRSWLNVLLSQASSRSPDAESMIAGANRTLTLACCSWPFDDHRTLLVCLA